MNTQPKYKMTPKRWRKVEDLYHAAREFGVEGRAAFLAEACGSDAELRIEVESLLAEDGSRAGMIDKPVPPTHPTQPTAGSQIGPYLIESSIGKGGMGEVWKARDSRLHRDVAIKFSTEQFTDRFA